MPNLIYVGQTVKLRPSHSAFQGQSLKVIGAQTDRWGIYELLVMFYSSMKSLMASLAVSIQCRNATDKQTPDDV